MTRIFSKDDSLDRFNDGCDFRYSSAIWGPDGNVMFFHYGSVNGLNFNSYLPRIFYLHVPEVIHLLQ